MSLTTIVLTKNAAATIEQCLQSLSWSDEILVVDDGSTDATTALAKKMDARVISRSLKGDFASQRNFALEHAKGDWILYVDSDEVVSRGLASEIAVKIKHQEVRYNGYYIKRQDIVWGKKVRFGENGAMWLLRLAKKDMGVWKGKVHEVWKVEGNIGKLENVLYHYPHPTLTEFLQEINNYTTIRAQELYGKGVRVHWWDIILYPKAKFLQNYLLKKGFRDGTIGLVLALCMSLHSFLVRSKVWQLQKNI